MTSLSSLKTQYLACAKCQNLCQSRTQVVFGSGNEQAKILFIGESPGATEDKKGIPFCGASGKILEKLLETINLTRNDIFITNTILCHPPKNRNPTKEEVENCRTRLDELITLMKPTVIVTIGNFATERIIQQKEITKIRGKIHTQKINNQTCTIIPILHPANYLYSGRNPEIWEKMTHDFQIIASIIKNTK